MQDSLDKLYEALKNPNWRLDKVVEIYDRARIYRLHGQYKTLCEQYGVKLEEYENYVKRK